MIFLQKILVYYLALILSAGPAGAACISLACSCHSSFLDFSQTEMEQDSPDIVKAYLKTNSPIETGSHLGCHELESESHFTLNVGATFSLFLKMVHSSSLKNFIENVIQESKFYLATFISIESIEEIKEINKNESSRDPASIVKSNIPNKESFSTIRSLDCACCASHHLSIDSYRVIESRVTQALKYLVVFILKTVEPNSVSSKSKINQIFKPPRV